MDSMFRDMLTGASTSILLPIPCESSTPKHDMWNNTAGTITDLDLSTVDPSTQIKDMFLSEMNLEHSATETVGACYPSEQIFPETHQTSTDVIEIINEYIHEEINSSPLEVMAQVEEVPPHGDDILNTQGQDDRSQNMENLEVSGGDNGSSQNPARECAELQIRGRKRHRQTADSVKDAKIIRARDKHPLREPCYDCRLHCTMKITQSRRQQIWEDFWKLTYNEQKAFAFQLVSRKVPERIRVEAKRTKRREFSCIYHLKDEFGSDQIVCKTFFLTTLSFKKTNDSLITSLWLKVDINAIVPNPDQRHNNSGKQNDLTVK